MKLTKLEKDILDWFKNYYKDYKLNYQIDNIKNIKREYTGHGFFINISFDKKLPKLDDKRLKNPINGPIIVSHDIDYNGGCILFHKNGIINLLEIYANGEECKKDIKEYKLENWEEANI